MGSEREAKSGRLAWRRVARILLPRGIRHRLGVWFGELGVERLPDRVYITRTMFPVLASRGGKVLFVGCRRYTRHYPALLETHGAECWTVDPDPTVARWGAPRRHVIGAIQDALAHWPPSSFDTILLSGVFGYGLDSGRDQDAGLRVSRRLLKDDGWFILGWNTDRCADPSVMPVLQQQFRPASLQGLPLRQTFPTSTHVFDFFEAAGVAESPGAREHQKAAAGRPGSTPGPTANPSGVTDDA